MDDVKRMFVYYLERLQREERERGGHITVLYDGTGMGFANLDIELYQVVGVLIVEKLLFLFYLESYVSLP